MLQNPRLYLLDGISQTGQLEGFDGEGSSDASEYYFFDQLVEDVEAGTQNILVFGFGRGLILVVE